MTDRGTTRRKGKVRIGMQAAERGGDLKKGVFNSD